MTHATLTPGKSMSAETTTTYSKMTHPGLHPRTTWPCPLITKENKILLSEPLNMVKRWTGWVGDPLFNVGYGFGTWDDIDCSYSNKSFPVAFNKKSRIIGGNNGIHQILVISDFFSSFSSIWLYDSFRRVFSDLLRYGTNFSLKNVTLCEFFPLWNKFVRLQKR